MNAIDRQIALIRKFAAQCRELAESPLFDEKSRRHWSGQADDLDAVVARLLHKELA